MSCGQASSPSSARDNDETSCACTPPCAMTPSSLTATNWLALTAVRRSPPVRRPHALQSDLHSTPTSERKSTSTSSRPPAACSGTHDCRRRNAQRIRRIPDRGQHAQGRAHIRAARYDDGLFQGTRIYDASLLRSKWAGTDWENYVLANVWRGNEEWTVELYRGRREDLKPWSASRTTTAPLRRMDPLRAEIRTSTYYKIRSNSTRHSQCKTSRKKIQDHDQFGQCLLEERISTGRQYTSTSKPGHFP